MSTIGQKKLSLQLTIIYGFEFLGNMIQKKPKKASDVDSIDQLRLHKVPYFVHLTTKYMGYMLIQRLYSYYTSL